MMAVLHLAACSGTQLPARMSDVNEAYPPELLSDTSAMAQKQGTMETTYDAPYGTVFRGVRVAITENDYTIESENRREGVILATSQEYVPPIYSKSNPHDMIKSYLGVKLSKIGPERTQVNLFHKKQGSCKYMSGAETTGICLVSFLIICPIALPAYLDQKGECEDRSTLQPGWHGYMNPLKQIKNNMDKYLLRGGDI